jgi:hypothetical protein
MYGVLEGHKDDAYNFGVPARKKDLACKNFKL